MPYPRVDIQVATSAPVENKAAKIETPAPQTDHRVTIEQVWFSYSAAPTGGVIKITDGTTTIEHSVTAAGTQVLEPHVAFKANAKVTVELAAGGSAVLGKLTVLYTEE